VIDMARVRWWTVLLTAATLTAAGCSSAAPGPAAAGGDRVPAAGGTMTFRLPGDYTSFDIQRDIRSLSFAISTNAYATLVAVDGAGKVIPYLAKSWDDSLTSITFTLRTDATCEDGTKVTPTVVKQSFDRLLETPAAGLLTLFGGGPFTTKADDSANTFTFSSAKPYGDRMYAFASMGSGIVCPAGLANPDALTDKTFGAGPYSVTEAVHGDHVTLKRRTDFAWGPNGITGKTKGMPDTLVYKIVDNETTAANLLQTGGVDGGVITGKDIDRLLANPNLNHTNFPNYGVMVMLMQEAPGRPTADSAVREAVATAIDPKAWGTLGLGGHFVASSSFLTPRAQCYDKGTADLAPKADPDAARKVLEDAGWKDDGGALKKDGKPLEITLLTSTTFPGTSDYMLDQLRKAGFTVDLHNVEFNSWALDVLAGKFDVTYLNNQSALRIPGGQTLGTTLTAQPLEDGGKQNYANVVDPVLNDELEAANSTSGAESCEHWAKFQQRAISEHHVAPLVSAQNFGFSAKDIDLLGGGVQCAPLQQPAPCGMAARRYQ
jgi:peptide/nickel transport system substrate-binding protein